MKTLSHHLHRALGALSILSLGILAIPQNASADRSRGSSERGYTKVSSSSNYRPSHNRHSSYRGGSGSHYRSSYRPSSRIGFGISFGSGYYGRPYYPGYYGGSHYYGSSYPSYSSRTTYSARDLNASVQQALARRGYYRGRIDGIIGSQSRNAIYRYQQDRRLQPTGTITSQLLRSLGL